MEYLQGFLFHGVGELHQGKRRVCSAGDQGKGLPRISKSVRQVCDARIRDHSRKPDEIRDRIVDLFGDRPRIELFARERFPGWYSVGFGVDGQDIRNCLQQ